MVASRGAVDIDMDAVVGYELDAYVALQGTRGLTSRRPERGRALRGRIQQAPSSQRGGGRTRVIVAQKRSKDKL